MNPLRAILAALSVGTRLPIPARWLGGAPLGGAAAALPLAGGGVWLLASLAGRGAAAHVDPSLAGLAALAVAALVTGGLHFDGLSDTVDGWSGGRGDRARALAIMRDGRAGPHGVVALVLVLGAEWTALASLCGRPDGVALAVAAGAVSRAIAIPVARWLPAARPDGFGAAFRAATGRFDPWIAVGLGALAVAWAGPAAPAPALVAAAAGTGLAWFLSRRFGGLTGDTYGAVIQVAEMAFLVAAVVR